MPHVRRTSLRWLGAIVATLMIGSHALPLSAQSAHSSREQSGEPELITAVRVGNATVWQKLLADPATRARLNTPAIDGMTALHWAVHRDDGAATAALLRAGAKANVKSRYGITPLSLACTNGNAALIKQLVEAGANPNEALPEGETPLMTAARTGSVDAVRALLAAHADVNAREAWKGQTALMWAVAQGHAGVAKALLDAGADVRARSTAGFSPLLFAIRTGNHDAVTLLLDAGADPNDATRDGTRAIVLAIMNLHYELATLLLDRGADPDADGAGGTALHAAVRAHRPDWETLPDPEPTGTITALDLIKRLLARGVNVNAAMTKRPTRLNGLNYLNFASATPFLLAARAADVAVMRLLVEHGADPKTPTADHTTPLMVAAGIGFYEGVTYAATDDEVIEAVRLALDLGADIHAANDAGETALHGAAVRGVNPLVQFLVDKGAKLDAKDALGRTALTFAEGVLLGMNTFPREHTAVLLRRLMGIPAPTEASRRE